MRSLKMGQFFGQLKEKMNHLKLAELLPIFANH
jgi:hypothetical protein